jgi:NAD-dependent deacetylase sirtuin 2
LNGANEADSQEDLLERDTVDIDLAGASSDANILELVRAAAAARGIPLEWILSQADDDQDDDDDDQDVEYPFEQLPSSLQEIANFMRSDRCRRILILAGAGMSVNAGIPDFRSADGLYATMNPDLLTANDEQREAMRTNPSSALDQPLFESNPLPCLELNREFILGTQQQRWKSTLAHRFVELLHAKTGKLVRLYTQNIDGLEDQCEQLPRDKVIAVHGSMDRAECASCKTECDFNVFAAQVQQQIKDLSGQDADAPAKSTPIICSTCGGMLMKPAIVLFRSSLPEVFFDSVPDDVSDVDLLFVIGTSLRVAPASSLVWRVPKSALRVLINREEVGMHLGMNFDVTKRDFFAQGNCDEVILELMSHLGWIEEVRPLLAQGKLAPMSANLLRARLEQADMGIHDRGKGSAENGVNEGAYADA